MNKKRSRVTQSKGSSQPWAEAKGLEGDEQDLMVAQTCAHTRPFSSEAGVRWSQLLVVCQLVPSAGDFAFVADHWEFAQLGEEPGGREDPWSLLPPPAWVARLTSVHLGGRGRSRQLPVTQWLQGPGSWLCSGQSLQVGCWWAVPRALYPPPLSPLPCLISPDRLAQGAISPALVWCQP